jgi:hypothetical protein
MAVFDGTVEMIVLPRCCCMAASDLHKSARHEFEVARSSYVALAVINVLCTLPVNVYPEL